jgi:hypothetical protein
MVLNTYSKRRKTAMQKDTQEIYTYDLIPNVLKVQIVHIWYSVLGNEEKYFALANESIRLTYKNLVEIIREEIGVFILPPSARHRQITFLEELVEYFLKEKDTGRILDVIELSFQFINKFVRNFRYQFRQDSEEVADQAIDDLNMRFKEYALGYRFERPFVIRIDSQFLHIEVVKPTLKLLTKPEYAGAQEEFSTACDHYKHGRKKEVLDACLKAFDSMMKAICKKRGWNHHPNATASPLIKTCLQNKLIPDFFQSKAESFQSLLESGVPTIGNKLSRHGQGNEVIEIANSIVAYALHETASILVLLDQAETELK